MFSSVLLSVLSASALLVNGLPTEVTSFELETRDTCGNDPIRGVNIGGWLVLEPYMNYELMASSGAPDQWTYDQTSGASANLATHWDTWFTEADVEQIAAWGLNTVRIPIGYWAYNNTGTPYIKGADAYLERALGWCRNHGVKALVCAHGLPGSQNGFDNSGHQGTANWAENEANLEASAQVLETMAIKYGTTQWADVVWGLELVNEEVVWDETSAGDVANWAKSTFQRLQSKVTNSEIKIIVHDAWLGPAAWEPVAQQLNSLGYDNFILDVHLYQNQDSTDSQLTQDQHIQKTCDYSSSVFVPDSDSLSVVVGEFSDQTNICVDANGNVSAGTSCSTSGCQCSATLDPSQWNGYLRNATRKFLEAQLDVFEENSDGWFFWSYTGPGAWGLGNLFDNGIIGPSTVTQRQFPGQCT